MKKVIYILVLCAVSIVFGFNVTKTRANSGQDKNDVEKIISDIRKEYKNINSDTNLIVIEKDLTGMSTEGGTLFSYYDKTELKKSVLSFYGEMGKRVDEYYFKEGRLIFLFKQEFYYNQPIYIEEGFGIAKTEENRYYFYDNKLVRWVDSDKVMRDVSSEESKKLASELIVDATAILDLKKDKSFAFSGTGNYEYKTPVSYITKTLVLKYNFYKLPDQLYIEDQEGNILYNTDMEGTSREQVKEITLSKVENIKTLIFRISTQKSDSRWKFSIDFK